MSVVAAKQYCLEDRVLRTIRLPLVAFASCLAMPSALAADTQRVLDLMSKSFECGFVQIEGKTIEGAPAVVQMYSTFSGNKDQFGATYYRYFIGETLERMNITGASIYFRYKSIGKIDVVSDSGELPSAVVTCGSNPCVLYRECRDDSCETNNWTEGTRQQSVELAACDFETAGNIAFLLGLMKDAGTP